MRFLALIGGCLLAGASADAPTCCACSPPASPPLEYQCAGDHGSTVGGKPCCGQSGLIASAQHICPRHLPACSGYKHSVSFGSCLTREEAAQRARDEAAEEGADDPSDSAGHDPDPGPGPDPSPSPKRNRSRDPSLLPPTLALAPTLAAGPEDVGEDDGGDDDDAATWRANSTRASRGNWSWPGAYNGSTGMRSSTHLGKES